MRKHLIAALCVLALCVGAEVQTYAQESTADKAAEKTKQAGKAVGDKAEDVGDATKKGAKKTGNWFKRAFRKIF